MALISNFPTLCPCFIKQHIHIKMYNIVEKTTQHRTKDLVPGDINNTVVFTCY